MMRIDRRRALTWMGTAAVAGAGFRVPGLEQMLRAQGTDWAARLAALPQPGADDIVIAAVGDMMISDPVSNRSLPEARALYQVIQDADVAFGNSEQPIADEGVLRGGFPQTAPPEILDDFKASGFNMLSIANNHSFDLGEAGLLDWIAESKARGFTVAGGGRNLEEATAPGIMTVKGQRVGMLAFLCAPEIAPDFRPAAAKSGIGVIAGARVQVPGSTLPVTLPQAADLRAMTEAVQRARAQVDVLMVSFHQHWNLDLPPGATAGRRGGGAAPRTIVPAQLDSPNNQVAEGRRLICRSAIEAGADMVVGHGPHVLNGVEMHRGKPIFYSLGHFYISLLRDGRALPRLQLSPSLARLAETNYYLEEHRWAAVARIIVRRGAIASVQLLPIFMDVQKDGYPYFPADADARTINAALGTLSRPFATNLRTAGWVTEVGL